MGQHTIHITTDKARDEAKRLVHLAPWGTYIRFKRNKRSTDQNSRMWALLSCVSLAMRYTDQKGWHIGIEGEKYSPDDWKDWFCHALSRSRWMPDENNGRIPIGMRTSDMDKQEHSDLTALIEAFAAKHGIEVSEPNQKAA